MTPGNESLDFEHAHSLKVNLKQYNVKVFGDGPARNLTTGRGSNKGSYSWSFTCTEDVENKRFNAFVQFRLVESKKSFFEPICKARLKTGTGKNLKILKSLSILKEACQGFGVLGNKAEKLAEAFKYPRYL